MFSLLSNLLNLLVLWRLSFWSGDQKVVSQTLEQDCYFSTPQVFDV